MRGNPSGAGSYTIKRVDEFYVVRDHRGEPVARPFLSEDAALKCIAGQMQKAEETQRTPRDCMCCSTRFLSEGKHNRLCKYCRNQASHLDRNFL